MLAFFPETDSMLLIKSRTEYDLSKFSSKTVTSQKIQQINSINLFSCVYDFYINQKKIIWKIMNYTSD